MQTRNDILNSNLLILHSKFPRIAKGIELFWGDKEFPKYINNLLADGKNDRAGFPVYIIESLLTLQILHDELYPEFNQDDSTGWSLSIF